MYINVQCFWLQYVTPMGINETASNQKLILQLCHFYQIICNFVFACDLRPVIIALGNVYKIITYIKLFPYQFKVEALCQINL